jgi:hypothetical protein
VMMSWLVSEWCSISPFSAMWSTTLGAVAPNPDTRKQPPAERRSSGFEHRVGFETVPGAGNAQPEASSAEPMMRIDGISLPLAKKRDAAGVLHLLRTLVGLPTRPKALSGRGPNRRVSRVGSSRSRVWEMHHFTPSWLATVTAGERLGPSSSGHAGYTRLQHAHLQDGCRRPSVRTEIFGEGRGAEVLARAEF